MQSKRILSKQIVCHIFARLVQASFPPTTCPTLSLTVLYSPLLSCTRSHTASVRIRLYMSPTVSFFKTRSQKKKKEKMGGEGHLCVCVCIRREGEWKWSGVESEERRWRKPLGELLSCLSGRIMTSYSPVYFTHTAGKSWQIGAPVSSVLACRHKL